MRDIKKISLVISVLFVLLLGTAALAAPNLSDAWGKARDVAGTAGYETRDQNLATMVGVIVNTVLSLLGIIFMVLMVYGGFLWMTDRGNEDQVKRARNLISAAVIGLVIVLASYAISIFVFERLADRTLTPSTVEDNTE